MDNIIVCNNSQNCKKAGRYKLCSYPNESICMGFEPINKIPLNPEYLLPCPFCGCENIEISADHNSGYKATGIHFCYCTNQECLARVFQPSNKREDAISAWNRRVKL